MHQPPKLESSLNSADDPESLKARVAELEAQIAEAHTTNAEIALLERRHQKSMQEMQKVIESLKDRIDSLQGSTTHERAD